MNYFTHTHYYYYYYYLQPFKNIIFFFKEVKSNFYNLPSTAEELQALKNLPEVPPSSPGSESDDFLYLNSPEKQRSEPLKTCGRSVSVHSGRALYNYCHSVKSAPLIKDGYNTD